MKYEEEFRELNKKMLGTGIPHDKGINRLSLIVRQADEEIADLNAIIKVVLVVSFLLGGFLVWLL